MTIQRGIRQPRSGDRKKLFTLFLDPTLRQRLGEIAEESEVSVATLIAAWMEFLAHRYDSTEHLILNQDEWGIEWRFTGGQLIWKVVSSHGRLRYVEEGMEEYAGDKEPDAQESPQGDLDALRRAARTTAERVVEAVEDEQD